MKPLNVDEIRGLAPEDVATRFAEVDAARAAAEERAGPVAAERHRLALLAGRVLLEVDRDDSMSDAERAGARRAITTIIARLDERVTQE